MTEKRRPRRVMARDVVKIFSSAAASDEILALDRVSLDIYDQEFVAILGPSGCGKSTFLNIVAGFEHPTSGSISLDGRAIVKPGPDRGVVFQEYALFPWMTVAKNIAFGLENRRMKEGEVRRISRRYIELVDLSGSENRYPRRPR